MNKIFLLFLLMLPVAMAEILVEPASISTSVKVGYEKEIPITITNKFNHSIFDLTFTGISEFTFPSVEVLEPNQQAIVTVKLTTTSAYTQTQKTSTIKLKYYTVIYSNPVVHNVTIFNTFYSPNLITIEQGDQIRWFNDGTMTHTVTSDNPSFDLNIPKNTSAVAQFGQIQYIEYYDKTILFKGYIDVVNKTSELTYNPSYDRTINFFITSSYNESALQLEILDDNFTLNYDDEDEGLVKITNTGDSELINIILTADKWISFEENNFNLDAGSNNFVSFKIIPDVTSISQTNKTHNIDIQVKATNANQIGGEINVFIPYESDLETFGNLSRDELIDLLKLLQEQIGKLNLEPSPDCPSDKPYFNTETEECIGEIDLEIPVQYNYTQKEIESFLLKEGEIKEGIETLSEFQNPKLISIESLLVSMNNKIIVLEKIANRSLTMSEEFEEEEEDRKVRNAFLIVIGIISLLGGATFAVIWLRRQRQREGN